MEMDGLLCLVYALYLCSMSTVICEVNVRSLESCILKAEMKPNSK